MLHGTHTACFAPAGFLLRGDVLEVRDGGRRRRKGGRSAFSHAHMLLDPSNESRLAKLAQSEGAFSCSTSRFFEKRPSALRARWSISLSSALSRLTWKREQIQDKRTVPSAGAKSWDNAKGQKDLPSYFHSFVSSKLVEVLKSDRTALPVSSGMETP
jgi:hypothetical protein